MCVSSCIPAFVCRCMGRCVCLCQTLALPVPVWGARLVLPNSVWSYLLCFMFLASRGHKQPFVAKRLLVSLQTDPCSCSPLLLTSMSVHVCVTGAHCVRVMYVCLSVCACVYIQDAERCEELKHSLLDCRSFPLHSSSCKIKVAFPDSFWPQKFAFSWCFHGLSRSCCLELISDLLNQMYPELFANKHKGRIVVVKKLRDDPTLTDALNVWTLTQDVINSFYPFLSASPEPWWHHRAPQWTFHAQ